MKDKGDLERRAAEEKAKFEATKRERVTKKYIIRCMCERKNNNLCFEQDRQEKVI